MASTVPSDIPRKDGADCQNEESNLNISLESDHLDPEQREAHEADTLPMDGPQAPQIKQHNKWSAVAERCRSKLSPILVKAGF